MHSYRNWVLICLVGVYLVIMAGGIVRGTGAGLGCPDWPKCFGQWVPPTSLEQLPSDYKTRYKVAGREIADFEAFKTWTEYINRLLGALLGIFHIALAFSATKLRHYDSKIFRLSWALLFLIMFQGWIGSVVVKTGLHHGMITLHLFLAMLMVFGILYLYRRASNSESVPVAPAEKPFLEKIVLISIVLILIQILLGARVRELVDEVARTTNLVRADWAWNSGTMFYIHRSFSICLFGVQAFLQWKTWDSVLPSPFRSLVTVSTLMVLGNVLSGIVLAYFGLPAPAQPVHLFFAMLLIGNQFFLYLLLKEEWFYQRENLSFTAK